jgi:FKBP-type peptidyl-prolyl cis-trans isomerase SlyD
MIKEVDDNEVTIDLNHPLCGERLHFDVKVVSVREATDEELTAAAQASGCGHGTCAGCDEHSH